MRKRKLRGCCGFPLGFGDTFVVCRHEMVRPEQDSARGRSRVSHALPFSFEQVLSHFADAFGKPAYKVHDRTFVYVEDNNLDDSVAIVISATERKIAVTLYASGDWGLNYIREFFEAPFFRRSESEQLYVLLDAIPRTRTAELGRFDVKIDIFKTRELIVIAIEFSPPGTTLPEVEASHAS